MRYTLLTVLIFGVVRPSEARKLKSPPRVGRNPHFEKRRRKLGKGKGGLFGREGVAGVNAQGVSAVSGPGFSTSMSQDVAGINVQGVSTVNGQGFSSVNLLGSKGSRTFAATGVNCIIGGKGKGKGGGLLGLADCLPIGTFSRNSVHIVSV